MLYNAPYLNAEIMGMKVNPDKKRVKTVMDKLDKMVDSEGVPYCPCQSEHVTDSICPCKYAREDKACRCGLYMRK